MANKKKRRMESFKMNFISAVTRPAQEGAQALLMKRADNDSVENDKTAQLEKFAAITTVNEGHSHLIENYNQLGGYTSYSFGSSEDASHAHPFIINQNGDIVIGEANGHTHNIAEISKEDGPKSVPEVKKDEPMTDEEKAQFDALKKSAERSEAIALLSDVQKSHFQSLEKEDADAFLAMGNDERETVIKGLQDDDPVVYTDNDGIEYRKSSDPAMVALAKRADKSEAQAKAEKAARTNDMLKKQADEVLKHFPGDDLSKTELCRAIANIEKESLRDDILDMLKANNDAMSKAFNTFGTQHGGVEKGSPQAQLDDLVAKYAEEHTVDETEAYMKVLDTQKGQELYAETQFTG